MISSIFRRRKGRQNNTKRAEVNSLRGGLSPNEISDLIGSLPKEENVIQSHSTPTLTSQKPLFDNYNLSTLKSINELSKVDPIRGQLDLGFLDTHTPVRPRLESKRRAVNLLGDILQAEAFAQIVFSNFSKTHSFDTCSAKETDVCVQELQKSLSKTENLFGKQVGFTVFEAEFFAQVLVYHIGCRSTGKIKYDDFLSYMSYFLRQARRCKNSVEFGFKFIDQNSSNSISKEELSCFLDLFWNKKIDNVLLTKNGEIYLEKFMKKAFANESLEFYMKMMKLLQQPYISESEYKEIIETFIKAESPQELNLPEKMRGELVYATMFDNETLKRSGMVRTEVFKPAFEEIKYLLREKVGDFTKSMKSSKEYVGQWFNEEDSSDEVEMEFDLFLKFVEENKPTLKFMEDVQQMFLKAYIISEKYLDEMIEGRN